jgi:signal transduction histidine kinase
MAPNLTLREPKDRLIYASIVAIACGVIPIVLLSEAGHYGRATAYRLVFSCALLAAALGGYLLVRNGHRSMAASLVVGLVWICTTTFAFMVGLGLHSAVIYLYVPTLLYTSLLCGLRAAGVLTALTIGALGAMYWAECAGVIPGVNSFSFITTNFNYALGIIVACIASLVIAAAYQRSVRNAVRALADSRREIASAHDAVVRANQGLEQRVAARTVELREKVDELETLNYSVAHDLRAPLRSINAFASRVRDGYAEQLGEDGRRMLARVAAESARMDRLLMGLLQLGRLANQPVGSETVDLSALAGGVAEQLAMTPEGARTAFSIEPGLVAQGDPLLLQTVLENLLANAMKFSRQQDQPAVSFGRSAKDPEPVFFVADNGVGFDPEHARQLFRPFFRLHGAGEYEGIGIGLPSVQRILQRHRGRVWATGMPGRGATFYFSLPGQPGARAGQGR